VRREAAGAYLKAAGIGVRPPGAWGRRAPAKAANETEVTTGSDAAKPVFGLSNYKAITLIGQAEPLLFPFGGEDEV